MSFFSNPFSYKRRREAEELQVAALGDHIAPETPPAVGEHHLQGQSPCSYSSTDSSPAQSLSSTLSQPDTIIKVRARAEYFESLIRTRAAAGGEVAIDDHHHQSSSPSSRTTGFVLNENDELQTVHHHQRQQHQRPPQGALFGGLTAAAAADALQNLRLELTRLENERINAVEALRRKTQEVENLHSVVRELTESRAAALSARATLAEQYVDLRRAHERVSRVADLSREVSKENLELTKAARGIAAEASKEAAEARREAAAACKGEIRAAQENALLRQKLNVLERIALNEDRHHFQSSESVCRREFTLPIETY